jgi:hypothetical protein
MPVGGVVPARWNDDGVAHAARIVTLLSCDRRKSFPFELSRNKKLIPHKRPIVGNHEGMEIVAEPVAVDPAESTIWVQLAPHRLSRNVLNTLAMTTRPAGEPAVWLLPWHQWDDSELQAALSCSYSWTGMRLNSKERAAFDAIHRAVVTACCTRLGELHSAIQAAEQRRAKEFAES